MLIDNKKYIAVVLCCQHEGCREKLGEIVFGSSTGAVSYFSCPRCKKKNTFVNTEHGVRVQCETDDQ